MVLTSLRLHATPTIRPTESEAGARMREITRASTLRSDTQSYYDAGAGSGTGSSCRGTKKARLNVLNSLLTTAAAPFLETRQSQVKKTKPGRSRRRERVDEDTSPQRTRSGDHHAPALSTPPAAPETNRVGRPAIELSNPTTPAVRPTTGKRRASGLRFQVVGMRKVNPPTARSSGNSPRARFKTHPALHQIKLPHFPSGIQCLRYRTFRRSVGRMLDGREV